VAFAGVVEDPFGSGGLSRVDMGHNPDITHPAQSHRNIINSYRFIYKAAFRRRPVG
jgi:hypothetical protein